MKSTWKYYKPTFDYEKKYQDLESAWIGHRRFTYDLVRNLKPQTIVELGTHKGGSFFSFCQAVKDTKLKTKLFAVDTWEGDKHTGAYDQKMYKHVENIKNELYSEVKIKLLKKTFDQAKVGFKNKSIDILHIDGFHTYQAVKHDFNNWLGKVKQNGIILLHDTHEKKDNFGVHRLWAELKETYQTIEFFHSHGLGVIVKNNSSLLEKFDFQEIWQNYYPLLHKNEQLEKQTINQQKNIGSLQHDLSIKQKQLSNHKKNLSIKQKQLLDHKKQLKKQKKAINSLDLHSQNLQRAINNITSSKTFKIWQLYAKTKQDPLLLLKGCKIFLTKGPRKLKEKMTSTHQREQKTMDINQQYQVWLKQNTPTTEELKKQRKKQKKFKHRPKISIITPTYNTDKKWLETCIKSVLNQTYDNWELCFADDASTKPHVKQILEKYKKKDKRIKAIYRKKNGHISRASNSALKIATGEFIALLDHDDEIKPHALYSMIQHLNKSPKTDMIYSDEDKVEENGQKYTEPHFKPDWSPDTFNSMMYTCHFGLYRKKIIDQIGGFRPGYEGSQDYDLVLRFSEKTQNIHHIQDILYTWRKIPGSTSVDGQKAKPYAYIAAKKALNSALKRRKIKGITKDGTVQGLYRVKYKLSKKPLVSIIIPTKDKVDYLKKCINSILKNTTYENYQILIVNNASTNPNTFKYYQSIKKNKKVKIIHWNKKYNFSTINNFAAKKAKGKYLLFLNNDTEIITPQWIESMLEHAQRKEVGAVGAKLLFPDKSIQHAGIALGLGKHRVAGHVFVRHQGNGYFGYASVIRNYSAVTAACLLISKKKFQSVSGFDPFLKNSYNDVDLCLKLRKKDYLIVYTPFAQLYHHESVSLGKVEFEKRKIQKEEILFMKKKWGSILTKDPYYNPNLTLDKEDFSLKI